ncbi:MAG: hypothetical protein F6K55_04980 [Moorea sp. SIO4A3]|nr:hypothetical protein [Moorena sp. SIO4A3]
MLKVSGLDIKYSRASGALHRRAVPTLVTEKIRASPSDQAPYQLLPLAFCLWVHLLKVV